MFKHILFAVILFACWVDVSAQTFSSYIGGSGEDTIRDVATDSLGNVYITGGTASPNFPVTAGSFDFNFNGRMDVFVAKIDPSGSLIWASFIGGPNYDRAYAIEVDSTGVYVAGRAGVGFPTTTGALQRTFAGDNDVNSLYGPQDGFAAKLSLDGRTLLWSTYLGGLGPEIVRDIAIDTNGNVYAAISDARAGFQHISAGAFDTTHNGGVGDGALVKINSTATAVVYGTYIGGSGMDGATPSVRVNASGEAFLLEGTHSTNMPVTPGCFQPTLHSTVDVFIAKFNAAGSALVFATYIGGNQVEFSETHGLALFGDQPIVAITTQSTNLPTTGLQSTYQGSGGSGTGANTNYGGDVYVIRLNATGTARVAATYLGGQFGEGAEGVSVDASGNVYVSGATYSPNFPTSTGGFQVTKSGQADMFAVKLSPDFTTELYGSFVGGAGLDYARASTIDSSGNLIVVGHSSSSNLPVVNAFQSTNRGGLDGALIKLVQSAPPPQSNQPPNVNAGSDQTVATASAQLQGVVTDDGLPDNQLSITWSSVSGPGCVVFSSPTAASTMVYFSAPGSYVLRLTATDSALVSSDDLTITVSLQAIAPGDFGVVVGSNVALSVRQTNYTRMAQAIDAATAQNKTLWLPTGDIEIEVPVSNPRGFRIRWGKTLTLVGGGGQCLSRLRFFPDSPTYDFKGFSLDPRASLSLTDLVIVGPSNPGPNGAFNKITNAINQTGQSSNAVGQPVYDNPYFVKLTRVRIEGEWYVGIYGGSGDGPLELTDCDITGYTQCVGWQATFNGGKSFIAKNTRFHDAGIPGKGHLVYISKPVAFNIDNCSFAGNFKLAIHHYGSGTIQPAFAILQNSTIESTCHDGIETADVAQTQIKNCVFNVSNKAVSLTGNATIEDCTFSPGSINTYDIHSGVTVNISRCHFKNSAIITSVWKTCVWNITDCDFDGASTAIGNSAQGTKMTIDNCRFKGTIRRGVVMYEGQTRVLNCTFEGNYTEAAVIIEAPVTSQATLLVDTCAFNGTGKKVWVKTAPPGAVTVQ